MLGSRRRWLAISAGAAGILAARPLRVLAQLSPQPIPSPHAPNPNFPPGLDGPDLKRRSDNRAGNPETQREIKGDALKLYVLATELKEQVERTDASSTLSLSIVKTAQQIEKLAKQIKNLSRG